MHHAQYRFQTFTRIWYFTSNSGISNVDCKVDLLTGPTSTSISGTSWLQSGSAYWAYFNLCFRNKVDLHTGPTSTSVSGTKLICTLGLLYVQNIYRSGGIAQRVDHPTGKPGAILMQVRVPGVARDFSPRVSFQCRLSHGVCTAPACNRMHQHLCAR